MIKASAEGVELGRVERTYVTAGRRAISLKVSSAAAGAVAKAVPAPAPGRACACG